MPIFRFIYTFVLTLIFIWFVFLLSWYVALPLLIVCLIFLGARWIYAQVQKARYRHLANGCTIHQTHSNTHTTIIDADYTEVP